MSCCLKDLLYFSSVFNWSVYKVLRTVIKLSLEWSTAKFLLIYIKYFSAKHIDFFLLLKLFITK